MLSKNQVVATREAIEKLYTHTCSIVVKEKIKKPDHSTGFGEKTLFENKACRISFSSISTVNDNSRAALKQQTIKLFIAPDIDIPEGSKIIVSHDGVESTFSKSGVSALYSTHQELNLDIFKGWA